MSSLRPKNWAEFQHYKDRSPAWIKLHRGILDDFDYSCLPIASKALAPLLWLLASEHKDGDFPSDPERIAHRLRWQVTDVVAGIKPLIDKGFFVPASGVLAECYQDACLEERRGEDIKQRGEKKEPVRSPTGSRLPADWCLPDDWRSWAERERPDLNVQREADSFADYWHGVAGAKGRKADWEATWRNWVRRADGRQRGATQNIPQPGKRMQAIMRLEAMKNGLGNAGNHHGDSEALLLGPGPGAGSGAGRGNGSGMG